MPIARALLGLGLRLVVSNVLLVVCVFRVFLLTHTFIVNPHRKPNAQRRR